MKSYSVNIPNSKSYDSSNSRLEGSRKAGLDAVKRIDELNKEHGLSVKVKSYNNGSLNDIYSSNNLLLGSVNQVQISRRSNFELNTAVLDDIPSREKALIGIVRTEFKHPFLKNSDLVLPKNK